MKVKCVCVGGGGTGGLGQVCVGGESVMGESLSSEGEEEVDSDCQRARDLCREQLIESEEQQQMNLSLCFNRRPV